MKFNKILAGLFSLGLILSPMCVYADESSVVAQNEDGTQTYTDYTSAWNAAQEGTKIVMTSDWDIGDRLVILEGKTVTIEMNGYKINRNLYDEIDDGEVIYLNKNSTLTLTGNNCPNKEIEFKGYNRSYKQTDLSLTCGGMVTGGASKSGAGGIHMKSGTTVNLENVAIAGNSSFAESTGGGGINMNNSDCTLNMKRSMVAYNYGYYGAGIYTDGENAYINMSESSQVANNCAIYGGGGFYLDQDAAYIMLDSYSKILNNRSVNCGGGIEANYPYFQIVSNDSTGEIDGNTSMGMGAGIFVDNTSRYGTYSKIKNITFYSNYSDSKGGAIYDTQDNLTIENCTFEENRAKKGGAIFLNKTLDISNSTITNNKATEQGGGVFVDNYEDMNVSGTMIIENNTSGDDSKDDVFLESGFMWVYAFVSGTPEAGSRIGIRSSDERKVATKQTENNGSFFSDEDGYILKYSLGSIYKASGSTGSVFGSGNTMIAVSVMAGIVVVGVICLVIHKKKNHEEA